MNNTHFVVAAMLLTLIGSNGVAQDTSTEPYRNPDLPVARRVADLLGRMTLEEKVAQLSSGANWPAVGDHPIEPLIKKNHLDEAAAAKSLANGLGTYAFLDEFLGLAGNARSGAENRNLIQSWVLKNTRLGIPVMFHGEALHGAVIKGATSFPQAVGLGSTWDPQLMQQIFTTVAKEERALGNVLMLGPIFDLSRDPRFGRVEEMYSEDPYLVREMGSGAVRGLQGRAYAGWGQPLEPDRVFATAKHFVHGQPENGTNGGPSDFSEHTLRSIFLDPFQEAVEKAHIAAVMSSYNETQGGIPSNANPWLLKRVLRDEWGFEGLVLSDYGAIEQLSEVHGVASGKANAGILAFKSGVDMELPEPSGFPALIEAVHTGRVSESDLDQAVRRVLTAKFNAGLFEHPLLDADLADREIGKADAAVLSRKAADEAIVLLKNKGSLLPLNLGSVKTIAVIGPNADKERLGDYSAVPATYVTVLEGVKKRTGSRANVLYAEGCRISEPDNAPNYNTFIPYKPVAKEVDDQLLSEAVETAKSADVIVLVLGGNEVVSREATSKETMGDSDSIELPGRQNELISRITKLGKPVVAVLLNGKAYAIEQLSNDVPAIVEGWYLGQTTGDAIAGVLFGDVNPSGHLPVTIARNVGQLPVFYYKTPNARMGYVFDSNEPLYPFGFGLSYTTFEFGKPTLEREDIATGQSTKVSVVVKNTGARGGDEVVQLYIHHPVSSIVQPVILLKAFKRVHLEAGALTIVSFDLGPDQLSILNADMKVVVESGPVEVQIGSNSVDTTKARLNVKDSKRF